MAGPSALSGLSEGLWNRIDQFRAENARRQADQDQTERNLLTSLMASDDPKIQSLAIGGMLDMASPKRQMKGVQGLLGEYERTPQLQQIHDYLSTPQFRTTTNVTPGLASRSIAPGTADVPPSNAPPSPDVGQAPSQASGAALPATSPVTGGPMVGTPPPTVNGVPSSPAQQAAVHPSLRQVVPPQPTLGSAYTQPHAGPAVGRTDTTTETFYPRAFESAEERYAAQERGKTQGEVAAWEPLLGREGAIAQVKAERMRAHSMNAFGGVTDGGMLPPGTLDAYRQPVKAGQNYRTQLGPNGPEYYPVIASATSRPVKVMAKPDGNPGLFRINPDNTKEFLGDVPVGTKFLAVTRPDGGQDVLQMPSFTPGAIPAEGLDATVVGPGAAAAPSVTAPSAPAPTASPVEAPAAPAPGVGAPPPGPQAANAPTPAINPAVRPPKPGEAPVVVREGGAKFDRVTFHRAGSTTLEQGYRRKDGKVFMEDQKTEVPDAAVVPDSANLAKPISAEAKKELASMQTSLAMMTRLETAMQHKGENTAPGVAPGTPADEGTIQQLKERMWGAGQSAMYSMGLNPSDPVYRELIPLANNLQVLATSPYLHGIRNQFYIQQIQQHIPQPTDSFPLIRQKLMNLRQTFQDMQGAINEAEGQTTSQPQAGAGTSPPAPTGGPQASAAPDSSKVIDQATLATAAKNYFGGDLAKATDYYRARNWTITP